MYLIAKYRHTALFSLRSTMSTSSGGKTLLVPTPFSIKMALIDAGFRVNGVDLAKQVFNLIKKRRILLQPPEHGVVTHTFQKILREPKEKTAEIPYIQTIAFREYVHFNGVLQIAIDVNDMSDTEIVLLKYLFTHVNYFGKRGSFVQFIGADSLEGEPDNFSFDQENLLAEYDASHYEVFQILDDMGDLEAKDSFDRINAYSGKSLELHKHRVLRHVFLPYKRVTTSKTYTKYSR